jgi:hypothetical protein
MANGFAPNLLLMLASIFEGQAPAKKITPPGYLNMLLKNGTPNVVSTAKSDASGHVRDVKYWYRQPGKKGSSATTDNCDVDGKPARVEATIPSTLYRKRTLIFEDDQIAQYEKEASGIVKPATNGTGKIMLLTPDNFQGMLLEIYDTIIEECRGLIADINNDLLTAQSAAFGVNAVTGTNAAVTVNFTLSTATNPLTDGFTKLIDQAQQNEFNIQDAMLVGSGLINAYMIQHMFGAKGLAQNGLNTAALAMGKNYFFDIDAANAWGANKFGVFDKGSVQFLDVNRFTGFKAGVRPGSIFFNAPLPLADAFGDPSISKMNFDFQIRYIDCPQSVEIDGTPTDVGRGWIVTIGKSFHQVNLPSDLYKTGDRLEGNNGTLLYTASNS